MGGEMMEVGTSGSPRRRRGTSGCACNDTPQWILRAVPADGKGGSHDKCWKGSHITLGVKKGKSNNRPHCSCIGTSYHVVVHPHHHGGDFDGTCRMKHVTASKNLIDCIHSCKGWELKHHKDWHVSLEHSQWEWDWKKTTSWKVEATQYHGR